MAKVLIIEDDISIAQIESDYLLVNGISSDIAPDGIQGLSLALKNGYDLILLDIMLPGMDGFEVLRSLRSKVDIPILMVTARQDDIDKIRGLGLGADDYIEKPFSPSVLIARVKANLAQYDRLKGKSALLPLVCGDIVLDPRTRRVTVSGEEKELKNREYELLYYLMENRDIVFSRESLYERIWGMDALGDSATVAVHINRLREKLEKDPSNPVHIQTVRGAGYRMR